MQKSSTNKQTKFNNTLKGSYIMIKWNLSQEYKHSSNIHKLISVIYHINKLKKNCMIIPMDSEKAFDKIQHPFMIKKKKSPHGGYKGKGPQHSKGHIFNAEKLKVFPLRPGIKQGCPLSHF